MQDRLPGMLCAVVCCMSLLMSNALVWAAQPGSYFEASAGFTRPATMDEADFTADPDTGMTLGVAWGGSVSANTRVEAEIAYAKAAWDLGSGIEGTADGFGLGANFLYDVGGDASPAKLELGIGLGWVFFDETCFESAGVETCFDAELDDWNVQGIVGGAWRLSERDAVVVRYRMWNTGGLSSEDRLHLFTVGYRRHF